MSTEAPDRQRTYGGWQQEKVAFLFGLSARRAAMLSGTVLAVIMPLGTSDLSSALVFWPAALVLAAAALVRVGGRTGDEWLAGLLSYAVIRAQGQHKFAGGPFSAGVVGEVIAIENPAPAGAAQTGRPAKKETPALELPGILAPLRLLSVPAAGRDLAVVENRHDRTYTAVARVRFPGIGLSDSARRDQRVAGWGALLASLCTEGSPLIRVQALQRLVPESGAALRSWHETHVTPAAPELARKVAAELMASATLATSRREAYLAVTMDARRAGSQVKAAGGGDLGAAAVLVRHLRSLQQAIAGADLEVEDWLGTRDLAEVIRAAYDPDSQPVLAARRAAARPGRGARQDGRHGTGHRPRPGRAGLRRGAARLLPARRCRLGVLLGALLAPRPGVRHGPGAIARRRESPAVVRDDLRAAQPAPGRARRDARADRPPCRGPDAAAHRADRARARAGRDGTGPEPGRRAGGRPRPGPLHGLRHRHRRPRHA